MDIHYIFGLLSGVIIVPAVFIYLFGIVRGKTKPNRTSWIIWNVTNIILFVSYFSVGARSTLFLPAAYLFSATSTLIFSFWYGEKSPWSRLDYITLVISGFSLIVWFITKNPLTALLMVLVMDAVGYLPTIKKSLIDPKSESHIYWILILVGSIANIFAINSFSFGIIIHPAVMLVMNLIVVAVLYHKKLAIFK